MTATMTTAVTAALSRGSASETIAAKVAITPTPAAERGSDERRVLLGQHQDEQHRGDQDDGEADEEVQPSGPLPASRPMTPEPPTIRCGNEARPRATAAWWSS